MRHLLLKVHLSPYGILVMTMWLVELMMATNIYLRSLLPWIFTMEMVDSPTSKRSKVWFAAT